MTQVILVNENGLQTGTMEKMEAHKKGLLHRAFSVFIFNENGDFLLQQRALDKYHSAGLWTNTCCSHPLPGEDVRDAAKRRLKEEMGFETKLSPLFNFIYKTTFDNGLTEHEFDHVFTGVYDGQISADKNEVKDYCFKSAGDIQISLKDHPEKYTEWFKIAWPKIISFHEINFPEKHVKQVAIKKNPQ